jgi:hypothetical protein
MNNEAMRELDLYIDLIIENQEKKLKELEALIKYINS